MGQKYEYLPKKNYSKMDFYRGFLSDFINFYLFESKAVQLKKAIKGQLKEKKLDFLIYFF
jgi:hypothetical protein